MNNFIWLLLAIVFGYLGHANHHNVGGFSLKRFLGISAAKRAVGMALGVPLSRSGRQRKLGAVFWKW
jgi:hypothetical protein